MSSDKIVLNALGRETFGSNATRRLRRDGKIPAIVYGHGKEALSFCVDAKQWQTVMTGEDAHLVELKFESGDASMALVKDVQHDFLSGNPLHVDFQEVKYGELISATIAVRYHGTPKGLAQGGLLSQVSHEIEISCMPRNLPESITVEIGEMELDEIMHVKDLSMPEGVECTSDGELVVFHVEKPRGEESEETSEEESEEETAE